MYIHHIALNSVYTNGFSYERIFGATDILLLYIKTPFTLTVREKTYSLNSPSIILFEPSVPHRYASTGDLYIDDYLNFAAENNEVFLKSLPFPCNTPIPITSDVIINPILEVIHDNYTHNSPFSQRLINEYIPLLLYHIGRDYHHLEQKTARLTHLDVLISLQKDIYNYPERPWSVTFLAHQASLSLSHFQVLYKQTFGRTCMQDVMVARMQAARHHLLKTTFSVTDIAERLGYSHVDLFIRQFKQQHQLTPLAYRKQKSNK